MKTATFKIDGMHCERCAQTIKALVTTLAGVHAADISFKSGQVRILYEPKSITEGRLAEVIEKGGFRVPGRQT